MTQPMHIRALLLNNPSTMLAGSVIINFKKSRQLVSAVQQHLINFIAHTEPGISLHTVDPRHQQLYNRGFTRTGQPFGVAASKLRRRYLNAFARNPRLLSDSSPGVLPSQESNRRIAASANAIQNARMIALKRATLSDL